MKNILVIFLILIYSFPILSQNISGPLKKAETHIVPAPTGNDIEDREMIIESLNKAVTGDTIQFSSGVYQIGGKIKIFNDGIILKGNSEETIIRGCQPENFTERIHGILNCGGFELIGGNLTIDNFIFEYTWHGLMIGCCLPENMKEMESDLSIKTEHSGGHTIQNNIFRFNSTGIRVIGINPKTVLIRNNIFQDNYHGLTINGANVTVEKNRFYTSKPEKVPVDGSVGNAIGVLPFSSMFVPENAPELNQDCTNILIKENIIENIPEDIIIPNPSACESVKLVDNIIKN